MIVALLVSDTCVYWRELGSEIVLNANELSFKYKLRSPLMSEYAVPGAGLKIDCSC